MARNAIFILAGVIGLGLGMPPGLRAQAARRPAPDYVVVYWYEDRDPYGTFRYKAYDYRKGEYDAERVAAWLKQIKAEHPGTTAYHVGVHLSQEAARTEQGKLAAAITRERMRIGAAARVPSNTPSRRPNAAPRPVERPGREKSADPDRARGAAPAASLVGSRWAFDPKYPVTYEFFPDGKVRHHTTSRVADGGWKQDGNSFSLWVGPRREEPDFIYKGTVRGDRLEGVVTSRLFPGERSEPLEDLWTKGSTITLYRIGARRAISRP